MNNRVSVGSKTQLPPAPNVRPVFAAMVGALRARRAAITHVLEALGKGLVVLSLPARMSPEDLRAMHRVLGEHLANGRTVLVNAANNAKADRRSLLEVADRHWAQTLAVVCPSRETKTALIASLPSEGWKAVVVVVSR